MLARPLALHTLRHIKPFRRRRTLLLVLTRDTISAPPHPHVLNNANIFFSLYDNDRYYFYDMYFCLYTT